MEKYDIFIEAGQSNAEGSGHGPVTEEFSPDHRIQYLLPPVTAGLINNALVIEYSDTPLSIETADERDWEVDGAIVRRGDLALTFAQAYIRAGLLESDRKILIIRAAVGGTCFKGHHWGIGELLYNKMLEMADYAVSLNPENRIKGLLWHQGESDACDRNTEDQYYLQFTALIDSLKIRYHLPELPVICGDFSHEWSGKNEEICAPICRALHRVARDMQGEFVETDGLVSNDSHAKNGDDIHFSRESLHILGRRYFAAYERILNGRNTK